MLKKCQDHLDTVHESYFRHLCFAAGVGLRLIVGGLAGIIHGLCPALFQRTASQTIFSLYDDMTSRLHKTGAPSDHHHHG